MLPIHRKTLKRFGKDSWKTMSSHLLTSKDKCLEILVTAESQTEVLQRLWILQGHYLQDYNWIILLFFPTMQFWIVVLLVLTIRFPVSAFVRAHLLVVDFVTSLRLAIISNTFDIIASPRLGRDRSETAQITTLNLTIETTGARCDSSKTP